MCEIVSGILLTAFLRTDVRDGIGNAAYRDRMDPLGHIGAPAASTEGTSG
jgi:hypothetical protein